MSKREVQFHSGNRVLRGELYVTRRKSAPAILVCHAMHAEGFRWLPLYTTFAERASERGFACLLFDFRGCGRSEGEFDYGWGEQEDARAAFEFLLSQEETDSTCAFIVGRSLGGTVALYSLMRDPRAKGFALWATPPDHRLNVKQFIIKRYGRFRYLLFCILSYVDQLHDVTKAMRIEVFGLTLRLRDLRRKLMALNTGKLLSSSEHPPILLLIGDGDEYVTLREAENFQKSLRKEGFSLSILRTGHTFKGAEDEAISITLGWFEGLLKSRIHSSPSA